MIARRHAARAGDRREQLVPVRDRERRARRPRRGRPAPVTEATTPSVRAAARASSAGVAAGADRLDAAHLRLDADERRDLARVAAQHRRRRPRRGSAAPSRCGSASRRRRPDRARPGRRARSPPCRRASIASTQCGESVPMLSTSAPASADHLLDLLARVRHHGQRAERERRVRGLVHDDVVRDLVDERPALAQRAAASRPGRDVTRAPRTSRTSTGPSPAPSSTSPWRTASDAARAAPRRRLHERRRRARAARRAWPSACSRRRASRRRRGARPGSRRARAPSKRWSTGSSPWPPVTTTAGAPSSCSRSASSRRGAPARPASASASCRFGVTTVASGKSRADERRRRRRPAGASRPELATITGSTTSGTRCAVEKVGDGLDQLAREEHPRLRGVDADVVEDRLELRAHERPAAARARPSRRSCSARSARRAPTCRGSPAAANAFRSAWMPAPPPESDVAIVRHRGTTCDSLRRHDPDQVRRV